MSECGEELDSALWIFESCKQEYLGDIQLGTRRTSK